MSDHVESGSLRALVDELLRLADDGLRTVTTDVVLAVTQAWFMRSVDMIQAALLLHDRGLGSTAHPLVRAAIEHAVGMLWLRELGEDALGGLSNAHQQWAGNVKKATALANEKNTEPGRRDWSPEIDELVAQVQAQDRARDTDGQWNIAKRFQTAKQLDLYVAWLSETASSHATQASATPYLLFKDDRVLLLRSPQEPDSAATINRCVVVAAIAFRAMGEALDSTYWQATVDRLEAAMVEAFEKAASKRLASEPADDWLGRYDRR